MSVASSEPDTRRVQRAVTTVRPPVGMAGLPAQRQVDNHRSEQVLPQVARPVGCTVETAHPTRGAVVLQVAGEVAGPGVWHLKSVLLEHVRTPAHTVIADLNEVSFLDVAALNMLSAAKQCAKLNRTELLLVTERNPAVLRALRAARIAAAGLLDEARD